MAASFLSRKSRCQIIIKGELTMHKLSAYLKGLLFKIA